MIMIVIIQLLLVYVKFIIQIKSDINDNISLTFF